MLDAGIDRRHGPISTRVRVIAPRTSTPSTRRSLAGVGRIEVPMARVLVSAYPFRPRSKKIKHLYQNYKK